MTETHWRRSLSLIKRSFLDSNILQKMMTSYLPVLLWSAMFIRIHSSFTLIGRLRDRIQLRKSRRERKSCLLEMEGKKCWKHS